MAGQAIANALSSITSERHLQRTTVNNNVDTPEVFLNVKKKNNNNKMKMLNINKDSKQNKVKQNGEEVKTFF